MKAQYEHDCNKCVFLGREWIPQPGENSRCVDIYFHDDECGGVLIARYSNEPSDYWSSDVKTMERGGGIKTSPGKEVLKRYHLFLKKYRWIGYTQEGADIFFTVKNGEPYIVSIVDGDESTGDYIYEYNTVDQCNSYPIFVKEGIGEAITERLLEVKVSK